MRVVCISDTHGRHRMVNIPDGDLLIHAGDVSNGSEHEVEDFLEWFAAWGHPQKVFLAGNMDYALAHKKPQVLKDIPTDMPYLENESLEMDGLKVWGSPYVPNFVGVFNLPRGKALREEWAQIPDDVDILITHGPPYGILDKTSRGMEVGCEELRKRVDALSPRLHVFGHVHESYGRVESRGTLFLNVSLPAAGPGQFHEPVVVEL